MHEHLFSAARASGYLELPGAEALDEKTPWMLCCPDICWDSAQDRTVNGTGERKRAVGEPEREILVKERGSFWSKSYWYFFSNLPS